MEVRALFIVGEDIAFIVGDPKEIKIPLEARWRRLAVDSITETSENGEMALVPVFRIRKDDKEAFRYRGKYLIEYFGKAPQKEHNDPQ